MKICFIYSFAFVWRDLSSLLLTFVDWIYRGFAAHLEIKRIILFINI